MNDITQTVEKLLIRCTFSLISSIDADGFPNTKAMLPPRHREKLEVFYFTTNTSSLRVAHYRVNPKSCIYFCDPLSFQGVQFTGNMEVLEDNASKEFIWRTGDEIYYPLGVTDPDYAVLRFTADKGRFYTNFSSRDF